MSSRSQEKEYTHKTLALEKKCHNRTLA